MKRILYAIVIIAFFSFQLAPSPITIYLVGDSTMSQKEISAYPETGWGMPFSIFFDSTVVVDNHAKNGRSTKSFMAENRWQPIVDKLKPGDYVFIQFGHNDEYESKPERYTTPEQFKTNLMKYVADTKGKGAIPILITPVARRRFDESGKVKESHPVYSEIVREVAMKEKVALIDLDKKSQELLQQYGIENSKLLFLQLKPGEHPNYPNGKDDNTHFNELGARLMAQLVLDEIRELKLELANHIVQGKR